MPLSASFTLDSTAFANNKTIGIDYTCVGKNQSPELHWSGEPSQTKSFALICHDPDAPSDFIHWVIYSIPATVHTLPMAMDRSQTLVDGTRQGVNDFDRIGYDGACPPPGKPHHYIFTLYALRSVPNVEPGASHDELLDAIKDDIIDQTTLTGLFERTSR